MKNLLRHWQFGRRDATDSPKVPPPDLRALYRTLLQARCLDAAEADLVARGEAFFHVSGAGHEASAVLNSFLRPDDYLHLHYRDKALMLARGVKPEQFLHSLLGNASSHSLGRQMCAFMSEPRLRILPMVTPVGNNALQSAGVASVLKAQGRQALVLCSMGDGSSQQGEVLEAIAEAVRASLPVLFFIQDNQYAISTRTRGQTFYSLPEGEAQEFYGLPIHRVDGRDPVLAHTQLAPIVASVHSQRRPALVVFQVERLSDHTNADDQTRYRTPDEIARAAQVGDPIQHLAKHLLKDGATKEELEQIERKVRGELTAATANALATWTAPPATTARKPLPTQLTGIPEEVPANAGDGQFTMLEAIREVLRQRLAADERVSLLGEDIEDPKGDVFGITRGLSQAFPGRVTNSALSESTIIGLSIGRALAGGRPVALIQFADFLPLAFNQILSELATLHWRTAGGWDCPVIILAPCGGFRPGLGPFHGQTMESVLAHAPGLDVFMPSSATDAAGLLNAAFESGRPTVFLYPKVCLNVREDLAPAAATRRPAPIGKARFLSRGSDLTLVTWGATVPICARVVQTLRSARVGVDLIDLRSISPWDREAVCESAERTGNLVVVHEDNLTAGFGAEVVAAVMESVPKRIAVRRITRPDTYVPYRFANQLEVLPSFKRILAEVSTFLDLELNWVTPADAQNAHEFVNAIGSSPADRTVTIAAWKIKAGDTVTAGDLIADVESDKAISELACPTSGKVEEILAAPGHSVPVGTPILKVRPVRPGERVTPTLVLQRGEPIVKRKAPRAPAPAAVERVAAPRTRTTRALVGLSAIATAEGSRLVTNDELADRFPDRNPDEILRLTGIETRRHLAAGETLLELAAKAASQVLADEGLTISDLDAIVCSTTTPEEITPSLACALQTRLCKNGTPTHLAAYDILAACSGFGIVTQLAFRLITKPESRCIFFGAAPDANLEQLVDAFARLGEQGVVNRGSLNIGYANRFVQATASMKAGAVPPAADGACWNFYALVTGTARMAEAALQELHAGVGPLCLSCGDWRVNPKDDPRAVLPEFLHPLAQPLMGVPDTESIKLIYRLTGTPSPSRLEDMDVDHTPFGMKSCIPVVPPRGRYARQAAEIVAEHGKRCGLNVKVSFFGDGRVLITIHFRTDEAEQVRRAEACERSLWKALVAAGFPPYRASIDQMPRLPALEPVFFELVARLKSAVDPRHILAPGRYCAAARARTDGGESSTTDGHE